MFRDKNVSVRRAVLASMLLFASSARADESEELLGVRVRALYFEVHGDVASGDDDFEFVHGKPVSLREDLEFRRGPWFAGEFAVRFGSDDRVGAHAAYGRVRNRRTMDEVLDYNDNVYVPGEELAQEVSFGLFGASWEHRWITGGDGELWAGLGLAYHNVNVVFQVERGIVPHVDPTDGERVKAVFPTIEAHGRLKLGGDFLGTAGLRAGVIAIPGLLDENGDGRFIWFEAAVAWSPAPWFTASLGLEFVWSRTKFHGREKGGGDFDNTVYELRLAGPAVAVSIAF